MIVRNTEMKRTGKNLFNTVVTAELPSSRSNCYHPHIFAHLHQNASIHIVMSWQVNQHMSHYLWLAWHGPNHSNALNSTQTIQNVFQTTSFDQNSKRLTLAKMYSKRLTLTKMYSKRLTLTKMYSKIFTLTKMYSKILTLTKMYSKRLTLVHLLWAQNALTIFSLLQPSQARSTWMRKIIIWIWNASSGLHLTKISRASIKQSISILKIRRPVGRT